MLIASLVALALCCLGLLGFCLWLLRRQRQYQLEQARRDEARDRRLKELGARLDTYLESGVRMGQELRELSRSLAPLPERITQLEQRDIDTFTYSQAAKLVGMGASVEDLTQSCGLSQSEAELVSKLHQMRRNPS
ncbi:DUF2802 domain-containing protein [Stutzerimonas marianensis]